MSIRILLLLTVVTVCYCFSLVLGLNFSLILVKLKSMLLLRWFRFLFFRLLGWEVPLILLLCLVSGLGGYTLHMQDPAGGQPAANPAAEQPSNVPSQAASPTSIHSVPQDDIWREVEKTEQACSSAPPAAREVEVGPSTGGKAADSGSGSESWRQFLNLSSASNEGRQPEGDGATSQPTGVMEPAPGPLTPEGTKEKLKEFLNSFRKRKSPQSLLDKKAQELGLETASQEKLAKIQEEMEKISRDRGKFPPSGQNAAAQLEIEIEKWEKDRD